jgi:MFS family permease
MRLPFGEILDRPSVPRLLTAAVVGRMPIGMGALAVFLLVREAGGSYTTAGLAVGTQTVAAAVGAPILGRLVDRTGQTRTLLAAATTQAAMLLLLAWLAPAGGALLFALCAAYGATNPPIAASLRASWATLLGDRALLGRAFSLDSTAQELIWMLGPLMVATLDQAFGARVPLVLMAGFVFVGTLWFATAEASRRWRAERVVERRLLGPLVAGPVRRTLIAATGLAFAWGALEFTIAAYAEQQGVSAGVLLGAWALGSVVGGLAYAARARSTSPQRMLRILLVLETVGLGVLLLAGSPTQLLLLLLVTGVVNAPVIATLYVLVEELAPTGTMAEAFTWLSTMFLIGISAGVATAGVVADVYGPEAGFALGIAGGAAALVSVVVRRRGLDGPPAVGARVPQTG